MSRKASNAPRTGDIEKLTAELEAAGEKPSHSREGLRTWLRNRAERELWFFARWILGNDLLSRGNFHREQVCPFLTDFTKGRSKLLMLPMGCLKTTVASRSLPLHVLIQSGDRNLYYPLVEGRNMRILLANENEQKCKENLSYITQHMEGNDLLRWLWPDVFWERRKDATRWTDSQVDVKRSRVSAEASLTVVGIKTGFIGRYFDIIVADDIAALQASQDPPLMERAKKWRRAARTRFWDKERGIFIGVGTHWPSSEDLYTEWKKDVGVEVMIRSIIEIDSHDRETPLWPEQFPIELIHKLRASTDPQEWACWYMNRPATRGYSALDWEQLREYQTDDEHIWFDEDTRDERIEAKHNLTMRNLGFVLGPYDIATAKPRTRAPQGMDGDYYQYMREKYPDRIPKEE